MAAQPPQVVSLPADNSIARVGRPLVIVAHDTEGVDSRNTLQHGDGRGVSIHCLIQKFPRANHTTDVLPGLPPRTSGVVVYRMVPDERGANHAGFSTWTYQGKTYTPSGVNVNAISLGFELECKGKSDPTDHYTDDQLLAAGWLINLWRAKYGPTPLVRHAEIDPTRRSDTFHLSTAELEKWATAAALVYASPLIRTVKAGPRGAIAQQDRRPDAPTAGLWYPPGSWIQCDDLTAGYWHAQDGVGFIPRGQVEE